MATAPKAPANLAQARKQQAEARKAQAASKAAHPAGKKVAPAEAPAKPAEAPKTVYSAVGRGGVERRSTSTTVLTHAVDVRISGRRGKQFEAGAVVAFYASEAAAAKAAAEVNSGKVKDWSDARVVEAKKVAS
jgi:hypothetical protein